MRALCLGAILCRQRHPNRILETQCNNLLHLLGASKPIANSMSVFQVKYKVISAQKEIEK